MSSIGNSVQVDFLEEKIILSNPYDIDKAQSMIAKYGKLNLLDEFLKFKKEDDSKY